MQNFESDLDDLLNYCGLSIEFDEDYAGTWAFYVGRGLFVHQYLLFHKARCVMVKVQYLLEEDKPDSYADIATLLQEAEQ